MQDITIMYLVRLLTKRLWILALSFILLFSMAFAYYKLVAVPVYSAKSSILVTNGSIVTQYDIQSGAVTDYDGYVTGGEIASSISLSYTIVDILNAPDAYMKLAEKYDNQYSYAALSGMGSVRRRDDKSLFIDITFRSTSGPEAMKLANMFAEVACEYVPEYIPNSKASVATTSISYSKISPMTVKNSLVAGIIGLVLAFGIVFIVDISNPSIRGEEEFIEKYDIPLLGSIPDFENMVSSSSSSKYYDKSGGYYNAKRY